jgi:hypothetical protein
VLLLLMRWFCEIVLALNSRAAAAGAGAGTCSTAVRRLTREAVSERARHGNATMRARYEPLILMDGQFTVRPRVNGIGRGNRGQLRKP